MDNQKGSTAPQAAGVIHGDFERGFIVQIINFHDLVKYGSRQNAVTGKGCTEEKPIMQPDDVGEF